MNTEAKRLKLSRGPKLERSSVRPAKGKNFGLSPESFSQLARELRAGDEKLFEEVFLAHFSECTRQLQRYEGFSSEEAYDIAMDALLHFRQLIIDAKVEYGNLAYLFTTIARQLHRKHLRKRLPTVYLEGIIEVADEEDVIFTDEDYSRLKKSFSSLGADCQLLLRSFYFDRVRLKDFAERQNRTSIAVRKQKSRCVSRLRNYFNLQR